MQLLRNSVYFLLIFSLPCRANNPSIPSLSQCASSASNSSSTTPLQQCMGITYASNKFGDLFPQIQGIELKELQQKLSAFVAAMESTGAPIIVTIPHEKAPVLDILKKANFHYMHGDNAGTTWIIRNKATIPAPYTAIAGGEVVVLNRKGEILVIEESKRRNKMSFPAGHVDPQEHSRHAACRELQEEVGLSVKPESLKLIALVNRLKANKQGASDYNHYYLAQIKDEDEKVKLDTKEVIQAHWAPVERLAQGEKIHNLASTPITKLLAKHIASGCKKSERYTIPNYRRQETPSWPQKDPEDVMHVELFQQNLEPLSTRNAHDHF